MAAKRASLVHSLPRLIPQLPDEVSIQCIARLPRFLHPTLALVSRSWRSLLNSPLLYTVRSDLGVSEHFLCINTSLTLGFYLLDVLHPQNPTPTLRLPPPPIRTFGHTCVSIGHTLFVLGGSPYGKSSREVQIFDARLNRWSVGPRMHSACGFFAAVGVINGRIYVLSDTKSGPRAEVLDPRLGAWTTVPIPHHIRKQTIFCISAVLGGKLLAVTFGGGMIFDPEADPMWSDMPTVIDHGMKGRMVVVDEVLYRFDHRDRIKGYDPKLGKWSRLKGWNKKLPNWKHIWLANVGGTLCIIWEEELREDIHDEIMLVGIKVSRDSQGLLMGSIVWPESPIKSFLQFSRITKCVALEL